MSAEPASAEMRWRMANPSPDPTPADPAPCTTCGPPPRVRVEAAVSERRAGRVLSKLIHTTEALTPQEKKDLLDFRTYVADRERRRLTTTKET